jgi:hypothetical protein
MYGITPILLFINDLNAGIKPYTQFFFQSDNEFLTGNSTIWGQTPTTRDLFCYLTNK